MSGTEKAFRPDGWWLRPATEAEMAENWVENSETGEKIQTYFVMDGEQEVSGALTKSYAQRLFGVDVDVLTVQDVDLPARYPESGNADENEQRPSRGGDHSQR